MDLFQSCIEVVLQNEGGFQRDPNDPGNWVGGFKIGTLVGTKYGIAAKYFPDEDIPNLTKQKASFLYKVHYWSRMNLEGINNPEVVLQIFDMGVNAGRRLAIRRAQKLAEVTPDGFVGPVTMVAINEYCGDFLRAYKHDRKVYYEWLVDRHPVLSRFLNGWKRRVERTKLF